jgi:hypothetical protein
MFQISHQKQISKRKGMGKLERAISLEIPSPATKALLFIQNIRCNKSSSLRPKYSLQQTHLKFFIAPI